MSWNWRPTATGSVSLQWVPYVWMNQSRLSWHHKNSIPNSFPIRVIYIYIYIFAIANAVFFEFYVISTFLKCGISGYCTSATSSWFVTGLFCSCWLFPGILSNVSPRLEVAANKHCSICWFCWSVISENMMCRISKVYDGHLIVKLLKSDRSKLLCIVFVLWPLDFDGCNSYFTGRSVGFAVLLWSHQTR